MVDDTPAPVVEPGTVLVAVRHSCISVGTELSGLKTGGLPLWRLALEQPAAVRKTVRTAVALGPARTWSFVSGQLDAGLPTGYSAAGTVLEVGVGIDDLLPGDAVACGGAHVAHHAEIIRVPRNLAVPVPEGLGSRDACTVTLGAIALQGVRRAECTLGETFVVIGLGVLGQLTAQLLKADGCRVIGSDLEPGRVRLALELGMDFGLDPRDDNAAEQVARLTDGVGADGIIITAASSSDEIVSTAFKMCRKKGRVVLVGDVGLDLKRADLYTKELDFRMSTSYGPGRYDRIYEERGLDYPVAYVRWTENRNMAEYLRLVATGAVRVGPLVSAEYPVQEAATAYEQVRGDRAAMTVVLAYPDSLEGHGTRRVPAPRVVQLRPGRVAVAVVGAGGFAKGMHLPNLRALDKYFQLRAVVSRTGHNAAAAARQFGAAYSATDYTIVLQDPEIQAVLISTRHDAHADMVLAALDAGKHVFVEKPLALTREELHRIERWFAGRSDGQMAPMLLTGFNRRFSPFCAKIHSLIASRAAPLVVNYRMNAGALPADHWLLGSQGGGRNVGEACHIYDLFTFLSGGRIRSVNAMSLKPRTRSASGRENFVAVADFEDGSVMSLTYTSLGSPRHPKEQMEIFADGKVLVLDDYRSLDVRGMRGVGMKRGLPDKGHAAMLEAFGKALLTTGSWPVPLWEQLQAMDIAFSVEDLLPASS